MSDPQKYRLYAAERIAFPRDVIGIQHFRSLAQMQAFADKVVASDLWQKQTDVEAVKVFLGRKDSSKARAYGRHSTWRGKTQSTPFITIPPTWAATTHIVLHELAHIGTQGDGHGAKYAAFYLELVEKFISRTQSRKLRNAFDAQRVEYKEGPVRSTRQVEAACRRKDKEQEEQRAKRQEADAFLALLSRYTPK